MDTYLNRANCVFFTFAFVLAFYTCLSHLSSYVHRPRVNIDITDPVVKRFRRGSVDEMVVGFDLAHDLSDEFNWNSKQLFLHVVATYKTAANARNEVTIWDNIIENSEDAKQLKETMDPEYWLRDSSTGLRNRNITLVVKYRVMPMAGIMYEKIIPNSNTTFLAPSAYTK
eukprot:Filipodium_phascolosomae@DN1643_c0_g1_i1.p1